MLLELITEINVEGLLTAKLLDHDIVEIVWNDELLEVDETHLAEMQNTVAEIGGGKKMLLLFDPKHVIGTSKKGRAYATSKEGVRYTKSIAVINENLAQLIMMNFFMKVTKPIVPTKGFKTREAAIEWLIKQQI